jgi:membrane protease YdiL (CAAX protease family)
VSEKKKLKFAKDNIALLLIIWFGKINFTFFAFMNAFSPNIIDHILVILLGIVLPIYAVFSSQPAMKKLNYDTETKLAIYWGNSLSLWVMAIVVVLVWYFSGRDLLELGFRVPDFSNIVWVGLTILFCGGYLLDLWYQTSDPHRKLKLIDRFLKNTPFLPQNKRELSHFFIVAVSAGVCEEIIFRGYFIQYLMHFTGDTNTGVFIAILIPALIFAFSHFYQGWEAVLKIVVMALLFGYLFWVMQSLWWLIILHTLLDIVGGILAVKLLPSQETLITDDSEE